MIRVQNYVLAFGMLVIMMGLLENANSAMHNVQQVG